MNFEILTEIIKYGAMLALGAASLYYQMNSKLQCRVTSLIEEAEKTYNDTAHAGGAKFAWVVSSLLSLVPAGLKPFVTRSMLERLVQNTFDAMEGYAAAQLDRISGSAEK